MGLQNYIKTTTSPLSKTSTPPNLYSRCHLFSQNDRQLFIKRDDELSWGVSGSKWRKLASLIPYLKSEDIKHVIIFGSPAANNLIACTQLLKENGFKVTAFLKRPYSNLKKPNGNPLLQFLLLNPEEIQWIEPHSWANRYKAMEDYSRDQGENCFILPEGSSHEAALGGALTLATDILTNEAQLGLNFSHIFVDAGTGFAAQALILGLGLLSSQATVHVVDIGKCEPTFHDDLERWRDFLGPQLGIPIKMTPKVEIHQPLSACSFGSTNRQVFDTMISISREQGIVTDPIYSVKLIAKAVKLASSLNGYKLMIHSGGCNSLFGFRDKIIRQPNVKY